MITGRGITGRGWNRYCIWEHSTPLKELYTRRCLLQAEEMTCHAQAAELLQQHASPGDTLLDIGCGSGYFYHSLRKRNIPVEYYGIDAAPSLVEIGKKCMPQFGLPAKRLRVMRVEDLSGSVDHVVCINVLTNIDNYHRPLERILLTARKSLILRESCNDAARYLYVRDAFLDEGVDLKVHVNTYCLTEFQDFITSYGFRVECITDQRSGGRAEDVIGYPHYWKFLVAERTKR